jgi:hypothetical protein
MRLSVVLLCLSLAGVVGGAWLIGLWAVGCAVIADSVAVGVWALFHDDGAGGEPQVREVRPATVQESLERVFDRARAS